MFTPIHRHPRFDSDAARTARERWTSPQGHHDTELISELIRHGAGEDFLQRARDELPTLDDDWDLRGFLLIDAEVRSERALFEAISFRFGRMYRCTFDKVGFDSVGFAFAKLGDCRFERCTFYNTEFYTADLTDVAFVECDFIESRFLNVDCHGVSFRDCYFDDTPFDECRFDHRTVVGDSRPHDQEANRRHADKTHLADFWRSVREGYREGNVEHLAQRYFLRENQAVTRYNSPSTATKAGRFLQEWIFGYGVGWMRPLLAMSVWYVVAVAAFAGVTDIGWRQAATAAAGALFTFGAGADRFFDRAAVLGSPIAEMLYVTTAFIGVAMVSLFVTTLANTLFRRV